MDAQKFGAFVARCRKDKKMTQADVILFTAFGVVLLLVAALSSMVLLGYSLNRKRKGKSGRQTFLIALISFCVVAIIFLAFVLVGLFGLGPTPQ